MVLLFTIYSLANFGFDKAEDEPYEVWRFLIRVGGFISAQFAAGLAAEATIGSAVG